MKIFAKRCLIGLLVVSTGSLHAQVMKLYPGEIPNAKPVTVTTPDGEIQRGMARRILTPTLEAFLPDADKATGAAVVVIPGGSYSVVVYDGEGVGNAKKLAEHGIAAFVLKYRLPSDSFQVDKSIAPLQDAQQAIKMVRDNAAKWNIDTARVGIMGFSAGGHLASSLATHYSKALIENASNTNLRPSFQILVYPVISMQDSLTHQQSRRQLLGSNPSAESISNYSNELQVDANSPPAYITAATDDRTVDVDNSIAYFEHLRHNNVPVEMSIYQKGGHGLAGNKDWINSVFSWMQANKWIK